MLKIVHLLDDFGMGGVVRALCVFDQPELTHLAESRTIPITRGACIAPCVDADVIFTHFPPSWTRLGFLWSLKLRNPNARLIHIEHSYTRSFEQNNVPEQSRFRMMLRLALRCFDEIICVSDGQRDWLTKCVGISPEKVRTIYPWSGREDLLQIAPPRIGPNSALRLAAYGRLSKVKNFDSLIEAVAKLGPSVELHLAGSGPDELALLVQSQPASNVTLHGQISDIGQFLGQAHAVIVPSRWESFGLVATEARLAARPIIVADVDGLPEQVKEAGLVAKCETADDIAAAIRQFQALPFVQMSEAARRDAAGIRERIIGEWTALLQA